MLGTLCLGIIALFFPPLAVVVRAGCGIDLLINILLCFLAWIPGVIHAWYIILKFPGHRKRQRIEKRAAYAPRTSHSSHSSHGGSHHGGHGHHHHHSHHHGGAGYGKPAPAVGYYDPPPVYYPQQQTGYVPARKY